MRELHDLPDVRTLVANPYGVIRNHCNGERITIRWDMNEVTTRDQLFELTIGNERALIDLQELTHYTRLV